MNGVTRMRGPRGVTVDAVRLDGHLILVLKSHGCLVADCATVLELERALARLHVDLSQLVDELPRRWPA